jgi:hypothetical protein
MARFMARFATLTMALLFAAIAGYEYTGIASGQASGDGWITLFDGKNLDQWQGEAGNNATWRIEDGSIAVDKKDKDPKAIVSLISKQSFADFELRAEFWVSDDANSGIYIRCTDPDKANSKTAYEVNIFDTRPDPSFGTGAIVEVAKAATVLKAGGKWNTYEIVAKGSKFTVTLNGVKTVDGGQDSRFPMGRIALQYGQGTVKFRKVQIKPL